MHGCGGLFRLLKNGQSQKLFQKPIVKVESGENPSPTIETLQKVAKALNISIKNLLKK